MSKLKVFGHKNPDTDTVTSALSVAHLLRALGEDAEAIMQGDLNPETAYALEHFQVDAPEIATSVDPDQYEVVLVDHNEFQQSIDNIEETRIRAVVDHHKVANFETADPLYFRLEPLGSTQTIVYKLYQENSVDIPKDIAGLMLSGIISDTLLFKSPTCTPEDVEIGKALGEIAGVDVEEYGLAMLKAGTNVDDRSDEDILEGDAKTFEMGDDNVRIGQVNVVDIDDVLKRKDSLIREMERLSTEGNYALYLLVITDILESNSVGLVVGANLEAVERAYGVPVEDHEVQLDGVVSRKKQVVPPLTSNWS